MAKVKLPRKRKKAFIKSKSRLDYHMFRILGEILIEEGQKFGDRFYDLRTPTKQDRGKTNNRYPHNNNIIVKRY